MGRILKIIIPFFFLLGIFLSCKEDKCYESDYITLNVSFYNKETKNPVFVKGITVQGVGVDSILYDNIDSLQKIKLPLDILSQSCTYNLKTSYPLPLEEGEEEPEYDTKTDIITFYYENEIHIVNKDCGGRMFHKIENILFVKKERLDSVAVENVNVRNLDEENVKIYL